MSFNLPVLPDGWRYEPLDRCVLDGAISYGVVQPGQAQNEGVGLVRVNNFHDGEIKLDDLMKISPEIESKYVRTRLKGGEVLITLVGSVGQVAITHKNLLGFNVARAVGVIHPTSEFGAEWISLCLRSPLSQQLLNSRANTTVQTTINLKDLKALPIPIPPKAEREKIVEMIFALDKRIALLRETNMTLEFIAQALFKSWFIDFDPVHAKAEGREPEGMDAETAALFPDGFEESKLGLIPKGWSIAKIEQVLELAYGKALKATDRIFGSVPVYGSGGVTGYHNEALINEPSVIVGRKGTVGSLYWEDQPFFPIDTVFYVKAKVPLTYCYYLLQMQGLTEMNTDGAVPGLNRNNVYRLQIAKSSNEIIQAFDEVVMPIRKKIFSNSEQINILIKLRDKLLPRLISGQLCLSEVEEMVGVL